MNENWRKLANGSFERTCIGWHRFSISPSFDEPGIFELEGYAGEEYFGHAKDKDINSLMERVEVFVDNLEKAYSNLGL